MHGITGLRNIAVLATMGALAATAAPFNAQNDEQGIHGFTEQHHPNHFRKADKGYWFEAFPNSKVPTSSLFLIIVAAGISVGFLLLSVAIRMLLELPFFSTRDDRRQAFSNLRVLGICEEKSARPLPQDEENIVPLASDSMGSMGQKTISDKAGIQIRPSMSDSDEENIDKNEAITRDPNSFQGLSASGGKKVKDANEIAGPIVPVLRNEDPGVLDETDSEEYEEESEEEPNYGPYQYNMPTEEAPSYERAVSREETNAPSTFNPSDRYDLPPPIEGSAIFAAEVPAEQQASQVSRQNPTIVEQPNEGSD